MGLKKYLLPVVVLFWLAGSGELQAQQKNKPAEPVYLMPDEKPQFPGGNAGIQAYFAKRINTTKADKREIVTVSLVVTKTSAVRQVYIGKGISPETDSAVAKIARTITGWKPGLLKGQKVNARVLFPVIFEPVSAASNAGNPVSKQPLAKPDSKGQPDELSALGEAEEKREIYLYVEHQPSFPGGQAALQTFLAKNLAYPSADREKGIKGSVVVQFVVEKSGALTDFNIIKPLSEAANKEALRVLKLMPAWQPGKMNGRTVAVRTQLVLRFQAPAQ